MTARRCLICSRLNPCPDHSDRAQGAELARNDAAIAEIQKRRARGGIEAPGRRDLSDRDTFVEIAATALAGARAQRGGWPADADILGKLPDRVAARFRDEARAVFDALTDEAVRNG